MMFPSHCFNVTIYVWAPLQIAMPTLFPQTQYSLHEEGW